MRLLFNVMLAGMFFALIACSEDSDSGTNSNEIAPTFSEIDQEVFQTSCAFSGCHATDTKRSGLDLSSANAYSNLVDIASVQSPTLKRVNPGNSSESYIIHKLEGNGADSTNVMPPRGALSQETIDKVKAWIDDGAKNN